LKVLGGSGQDGQVPAAVTALFRSQLLTIGRQSRHGSTLARRLHHSDVITSASLTTFAMN
jgi:hypothetical protein